MRSLVESLPGWFLYLHLAVTLILCWSAFSTWRLSLPGSGYQGITREYWAKLAFQVGLALVAVLIGVGLVVFS